MNEPCPQPGFFEIMKSTRCSKLNFELTAGIPQQIFPPLSWSRITSKFKTAQSINKGMTYISFSSACSKRSNIGRNDSNCRLIHSTLAALRGRTSQEKGLGVRRTPCMRSSMQISSGVSNKRWRDLLHSCHSYQWVLGDQYLDPWEGRNQMPKGGSSRSEPIRV